MILILSSENDLSTNKVIDWLCSFDADYCRISKFDLLQNVFFDITNKDVKSRLDFGEKVIDISTIVSFWYRRSEISTERFLQQLYKNVEFNKFIFNHLQQELKTIEDYIVFKIGNKRQLGIYRLGSANKLISLDKASKVGLLIPKTLICTNKKMALDFFKNNSGCITKSVQDLLWFWEKNTGYYFLTEKVSKTDIELMDESFFPSLLQNQIEKKYEVRVFYLNGTSYSLANFSQKKEETAIDYRNEKSTKNNRQVPFKLPDNISKKIKLFMDSMYLNTGSIDMIVTPKLEFVFLEVNPIGQYDVVSVLGNYYLDEKIAKFLINE